MIAKLLVAFLLIGGSVANKPDSLVTTTVETVLCAVSEKPWECVRSQAGRVLHNWEDVVNEKRDELLVEADEEVEQKIQRRSLSAELAKEKPSSIIKNLESGFSILGDFINEGYENLFGRESRKVDNTTDNDEAQGKSSDDDDDDDEITNDFNDDLSVYEAIEKSEDEGRASGKKTAVVGKNGKGTGQGKQDIFDDSLYGYGGGYGGGYRGGKGKKGGFKKKHKKQYMKLFLLGAILKSKIELLLKILSFKLQLKFFAIALVGLLINVARFWIELKKQPQKVIYYEHAQHQHHYDEHEDGWSGGYWKRSAQEDDRNNNDYAQRLAYNQAPFH